MRAEAIVQAREHLERVQEGVSRLKEAKTFAETRRAWSDVLAACSTIYNKLEQGAKVDGKSNAWFGRIKHTRKTDQLLSYVQHARNANEHALVRTVSENASRRVYFADPKVYHNAPYVIGHGPKEVVAGKDFFFKVTHESGRDIPVFPQEPEHYLAAAPAVDSGVTYALPTEHLGDQIEVDEPLGIATLALSYMEDLIRDAESYVVRCQKFD